LRWQLGAQECQLEYGIPQIVVFVKINKQVLNGWEDYIPLVFM
jgi:hypothetical protein